MKKHVSQALTWYIREYVYQHRGSGSTLGVATLDRRLPWRLIEVRLNHEIWQALLLTLAMAMAVPLILIAVAVPLILIAVAVSN